MSLFNRIASNFILPNAYNDWTTYRDTLTKYLIKETDCVSLPLNLESLMEMGCSLPTLAIIGAGACNDIDLSKLMPHFSKITLIDYDRTAMKQALSTYHIASENCIEIKPLSLNGIKSSDYESFCDDLQAYVHFNQKNLTLVEFEDFALSRLKNIYETYTSYDIPLEPNGYDYIWCFGVHSQFQAMFSYITQAFLLNLKEMLPSPSQTFIKITNYLKLQNDIFIPHFHNALLRSAKKAVFLGLEQHRENNTEAIEGANQAIEDIRSRNLNVTESTILWPFYPEGNISYQMLIQKIIL